MSTKGTKKSMQKAKKNTEKNTENTENTMSTKGTKRQSRLRRRPSWRCSARRRIPMRRSPVVPHGTVRIEPDGYGDVRVSLPARDCDSSDAVCTTDGRAVSNSPSATVQGPVGISIDNAEVE